ncbi:probable LRR receptor-like serine/threonine-protein kinase At3g47570 [Vigna unguiculata]|uniref:probable LRR receptor-like serine/threonine-protein kinase At3g47570 n=1 Tax=Vigna unguiculata TaxID=3917 RepID=UPI0010171694|nr:probable LRR receptor-like serine/threonine-protein kinase At3g47570 [Vigna unguiculata]
MKRFSLLFWFIYVPLLFHSTCNSKHTVFASESEIDHMALIKFKESISSDPNGILVSWNTSIHFCNWYGITCHPTLGRVTELNLQGHMLKGYISPHIGNLSYTRRFELANNSFYGNIPLEVGRLSQLQIFDVQNNTLVGEIPLNLTHCTQLRSLYLYGNNLKGRIPTEIGLLRNIQFLNFGQNQLTGQIPSSIGNLSSITELFLNNNILKGEIPQEICHLKSLVIVALGINNLSGSFPSCLYNVSSLIRINLVENQFSGPLSPNMFHSLQNLQVLFLANNKFSGPIPPSIANASSLSILGLSLNRFVGRVPSLGKLQDLYHLNLAYNNLGHLPNSLGNLSTQLSKIYLGNNEIYGEIPEAIGNLVGLTLLTMFNNHVDGIIPTTFGKLTMLQALSLLGNKLSGKIEPCIGNLSQLFHLDLRANRFEGSIPPSIGNCQMLHHLDLSLNNLTGTIPPELFNLSSLFSKFDLSRNSLSGSIPDEVGNIHNIIFLDMSNNHISGHIPLGVGKCVMLEYLFLQGNSLQGVIPSSLASLKSITVLDLSQNHLSGSIPNFLQNLSFLQYLNVSFNVLEGEVPTKGVFGNVSVLVVNGNSKLYGGISELHLPPCPVKSEKHAKHHKFRLIVAILSVVVFLIVLSSTFAIYWSRKEGKKPSLNSSTIDQLAKVSYQSLYNGTDGFSTTNLIGCGNFSSVYKGTLELQDRVVAIKVLNLQRKGAHKSFVAECNALKNIKHRNLVQILTCCSSTDYKGQEFKALIFEYMRNGSLEQWLHPTTTSVEQPRTLSLKQRLSIMIDVASALQYLHHECEQPIIHCDLKPGNILLDDDMIAHVSDFGIARLLSTTKGITSKQSSTFAIKGTVGYVAPEYGVGAEVSTYGDMFSFGILMLEMLTGRRPTDEMFEDGQNICNFVAISFPSKLFQILDPRLIPIEENDWNLNPDVEKCLVSLFRIGLACAMESPKERMDVVDVSRELHQIKKAFASCCAWK